MNPLPETMTGMQLAGHGGLDKLVLRTDSVTLRELPPAQAARGWLQPVALPAAYVHHLAYRRQDTETRTAAIARL